MTRYWYSRFREGVIGRLENNFDTINKYGFVFVSFAYISMMNFIKNTECKICKEAFQNAYDYYNHFDSYEHFNSTCDKYDWVEQNSKLWIEINGDRFVNDIACDWQKYEIISKDYCNDFYLKIFAEYKEDNLHPPYLEGYDNKEFLA